MSNKNKIIIGVSIAIALVGILVLLYIWSSGTNPEQNAQPISTQGISSEQAAIKTSSPLPEFLPNINFIKSSENTLSVTAKNAMLNFSGNVAGLLLSYTNRDLDTAPLVRYSTPQAVAKIFDLEQQIKSSSRASQYGVVDGTRPIGLFKKPGTASVYIFTFEASLYDISTSEDAGTLAGRTQIEVEVLTESDGALSLNDFYISTIQ